MKRLILLLATVTLVASGCGPAKSGNLGPGPSDSPLPASGSPTTQPSGTGGGGPAGPGTEPGQPPESITIETWFTRADKIFLTYRTRPATTATSRLALTELIAGPSGVESAVGVSNAIPLGTSFTVTVNGAVATVNFPAAFYDTNRDRARLRQAQVVYTLTQFPTVSRVGFMKDGQAAGAPVGRNDYADFLPRIVVTSPVIGQPVGNPITITGLAEVFESTVQWRVLDSGGREIAKGFSTAHCVPQCVFEFSPPGHGRFSTTASYRLPREQSGTVQIYWISPENGSQQDVINIPVVLTAS